MTCPICSGNKRNKLYTLCSNMKIMGPSFSDSSSYLVKCQDCGLVFLESEAGQKEYLDYYKNWAVAPKYYEMFGKTETNEYYDHLIKIMDPYLSLDSKIIDVAGAWGELASYMISKGFTDITVLDPNEKCIRNAEAIGAKVALTDSIEMKNIGEKSFDCVILNHSLEHIIDIKNTANNIQRILNDNGYLFIEIPDVSGYEYEDASPFSFLTFEHVIHMTINDLDNFAAQYGFIILEKGRYYKKVSNYPSIYAVLKKGTVGRINYSDEGSDKLLCYIKKSEKEINDFIMPLKQTQEPLILWGIGASTAILLESFKGCNVQKLIDKSSSRQGLKFNINEREYIVRSPEHVGEGTIVILSIPYRSSIERQIREMGLKNKIITLK